MAGAASESLHPRAPNHTRSRILDAARRLFAEHGYSATSVRMIARTLGISDPAIHYHFPTKQSLYSALLVQPDYGELPLDRLPISRAGIIEQVMHLLGWWLATPELGQMLLREQLASDEASVSFLHVDDETWQRAVTAPLSHYLGRDGTDIADLLFDLLAGVYWDAILSFGDHFGETVRQDYFLRRVRAMIDLAIPAPGPGVA